MTATAVFKGPVIGAMQMPADFKYKEIFLAGRPKHEPFDAFRRKHPEMEPGHRAKIFAPFDALKGFKECIASKQVPYEKKRSLSDEAQAELDRKIIVLRNLTWNSRMAARNRPAVKVRYFVPCSDPDSLWYDDGKNLLAGGQYLEVTGICRKVDAEERRIIQIDDFSIPLDDVLEISDADANGKLFATGFDDPEIWYGDGIPWGA